MPPCRLGSRLHHLAAPPLADLLKKSAEVIQLHKVVFAHDAKYQDEADKNTHKNKINIDGTDEEPSHLSASEFAPFAVPRVTATIEAGELGRALWWRRGATSCRPRPLPNACTHRHASLFVSLTPSLPSLPFRLRDRLGR